jgi:hypothetical protein
MNSQPEILDLSDLSENILATSQDLNNVLASGGIKFSFRSHYVDTSKGINGIEELIVNVLQEANAILPENADKGQLRKVAIGSALFVGDIHSEVSKAFGLDRYPASTIKVYLNRLTHSGKVGVMKLTKAEDATSKTRPRRKYFLIA